MTGGLGNTRCPLHFYFEESGTKMPIQKTFFSKSQGFGKGKCSSSEAMSMENSLEGWKAVEETGFVLTSLGE